MHQPEHAPPDRSAAAHIDSARQAPASAAPYRAARQPTRTTPPLGRLGQAALRVAGLGWPVFPVQPRAKIPAISGWEDAATTDPGEIAEWWSARPWNIGLSAGRAGLLVVDLDRGGADPPPPRWAGVRDGVDVLARLAAAAGEPPPTNTYTVWTPSGGRHLYFRQPDDLHLRNTQAALGWHIDTRGHGGYVLAAGSRLYSGAYRELWHPVAELPGWLAAALAPRPDVVDPVTKGRSVDEPVVGWRARAYLRAVVAGERRNVAAAPVGQRHGTLLRAALRLGQWVGGGALAEYEARAVLADAARGYIGVGGYTMRQVERDITDGLAYGARRPRNFGRNCT